MVRVTSTQVLRWSTLLVVLPGLWACGAARWETQDPPPPVSSPSTVSTTVHTQRPQRLPGNTVSSLLNDYYATWRGTPYRFGGTTRKGIDCSAFTQQAMRSALGVKLPRTTASQLARGRSIAPALVRPGDLVFFRTGETLNHVGVMVGPGKFMHASTSNGVTISRTDDSYWGPRVIDYRRVLD